MIWVKTETERAEFQRRTVLKDRSLRALLVLIDGKKSEEGVLRSLPGSTADDFKNLHALGLIEPAAAFGHSVASAPRAVVTPHSTTPTRTLSSADHEELVGRLRELISAYLGLAGLSLTLALEKAQTLEELAIVARRMLE
ncbi:MAG: hypothetical protein ABI357_04890 [Granulicella sp.]